MNLEEMKRRIRSQTEAAGESLYGGFDSRLILSRVSHTLKISIVKWAVVTPAIERVVGQQVFGQSAF